MAHWSSSKKRPSFLRLRDDGDPGTEGAIEDVTENGVTFKRLKRDPITGAPIELPRDARPPWPPDAAVYLRDKVTGGDFNLVQELQTHFGIQAEASDPEAAKVDFQLRIRYQPIIYAAVLLERLECKIGTDDACSNAFEDPDTCDLDENGEVKEGTGTLLVVPPRPEVEDFASMQARIDFAKALDVRVLSYVNQRVTEMASSPLPSSVPLGTSTSGASEQPSTPTSGSSHKSK